MAVTLDVQGSEPVVDGDYKAGPAPAERVSGECRSETRHKSLCSVRMHQVHML